jgi:hypothetical protein
VTLPPGLSRIIAQTRLFTDAKRYVILKIDLLHGADVVLVSEKLRAPFVAYLRDKDEGTLVLSEEAWEQIRPSLSVLDISPLYRLITFDAPLDFELVGYFAALSAVLVDVGASIFALSAFSRDHIFVTEADFDRAWEALQAFIQACQAQKVVCCGDVELE